MPVLQDHRPCKTGIPYIHVHQSPATNSAALALFTLVNVAIILIGILSGCVVIFGFITTQQISKWTPLFLIATMATTVTGFLFPFNVFTPAIDVGILSMAILILAILALYKFRLAGSWPAVYVGSVVVALYFNVFVLVVQSFLKNPTLHALAPQGSEPPFAIAQGVVLLLFVVGVSIGATFSSPSFRVLVRVFAAYC